MDGGLATFSCRVLAEPDLVRSKAYYIISLLGSFAVGNTGILAVSWQARG